MRFILKVAFSWSDLRAKGITGVSPHPSAYLRLFSKPTDVSHVLQGVIHLSTCSRLHWRGKGKVLPVSKNVASKFSIYITTVRNCDGHCDLAVAASSPQEAAELFAADLRLVRWKKIANDELQEALADWARLSDSERRDKPTLPSYEYGWFIDEDGERCRTLESNVDAYIRIWEENSDSMHLGRNRIDQHQLVHSRTVQILDGFRSFARNHRR
jgi:hypothetical protein